MLQKKLTTPGGQLPPQETPSGPRLGFIAAHEAANETDFSRANAHQRRMRRQRRNERSKLRGNSGWSVGLW
jgi:hypothetical protein